MGQAVQTTRELGVAEWERAGKYHEQRGPHRVSAAKTPAGWRFSAWRSTASGWEWIGTCATADAARALCE